MELRKILLFGFMISGMSALIYEVVWARQIQPIFGSTIYAVSTILATFFIGFALGSYLFRNIADKSKNPEKVFGLIQLSIGIYGIIILFLFKIITPIYLALNIPILQFVLLSIILIIPAVLFGGTWPIISRAYITKDNLGRGAGKIYTFNSFGSAIGPILAGFFLIPLLGITKTSIFTSLLNLFLGIIFISLNGGKNEF